LRINAVRVQAERDNVGSKDMSLSDIATRAWCRYLSRCRGESDRKHMSRMGCQTGHDPLEYESPDAGFFALDERPRVRDFSASAGLFRS